MNGGNVDEKRDSKNRTNEVPNIEDDACPFTGSS